MNTFAKRETRTVQSRTATRNRIGTLAEMHTYCRPHGSATNNEFIDRYIRCLPGADQDPIGNWHVVIGDAPIIWSCHTDTVHGAPGRQRITCDVSPLFPLGILGVARKSRRTSTCLGADDTVGVFLAREMVLAGVPGRYIFHDGEEIGCVGSRGYADWGGNVLADYQAAIAFDRAGTDDVITHQMGARTCSDTFARALADQLNTAGLAYAPCDRGVYTDTESYAHLVPECTNLSVGYYGAHSRAECVDVGHVFALLAQLLAINTAALPIVRQPSRFDWDTWNAADGWNTWDDTETDLTRAAASDLTDEDDARPYAASEFLREDWAEIQAALRDLRDLPSRRRLE